MNDHNGANDNVVPLRRNNAKRQQLNDNQPPFLNLPQATKYLMLVLTLIHAVIWTGSEIFHAINADYIFYHLGFISARLTNEVQGLPFDKWAVISLFTFTFLHGGWLHLFINVASLAAFGAGIEKILGAKRMLVIFFATSLIAAFAHLAATPYSENPIIGASGGISGLFGAVLVMLKVQGRFSNTNQRLLPIIVIFLLMSIGFGYMGAPDGSPIAWVAHIGGFVGGLAIGHQMTRKLRL